MATGLGSPNATALAQSLCTDAIALSNPGPQGSTVKKSLSLQIKAADTRGAAVTYTATGLPSGLTINGSTGKITGQPKRIGNSTVTVIVADSAGTTAQTTFDWTIEGAPTVSHLSLSSVGAGRPRLSFTVRPGATSPRSRRSSLPCRAACTSRSPAPTVTVTGPRAST